MDTFVIGDDALTGDRRVQSAVAVPGPNGRMRLQPRQEFAIVGTATTLVLPRRRAQSDQPTPTMHAGLVRVDQPPHRRALRNGASTFFPPPLQRLDVERLLGDDEFQPAVLILELLEPLHLAELHAAELRFPAIVRLPVIPCVRQRSDTFRPASPSLTMPGSARRSTCSVSSVLPSTEDAILRVADQRGPVSRTHRQVRTIEYFEARAC